MSNKLWQLIQVEPEKTLEFNYTLGELTNSDITLTNKTNSNVAFKVIH